MIKYLKIDGLNGNNKPLEYNFNDDLNLFTGLNGCGKTTILKVLWFVNTGRVLDLFNEVLFQSIKVISDKYEVNITKTEDSLEAVCLKDGIKMFGSQYPFNINYLQARRDGFDFSKLLSSYSEETIFFPTFRRIEGGFSMERQGMRLRQRNSFPLKDVLSDLSDELSTEKNQFIASVSTDDIISLLNREYSTIVRDINDLQKRQFDIIRRRIKTKKGKNPEEILAAIEKDINTVEQKRDEAIKPFTALEMLILKIFHKKGINMDTITFGDLKNAISSDKLSAGEKQMLSFLCYNTFSKNKVIFIDEPELSLHPDWQRLLIPTLLKQGNNNQFFIATHSPFIYTKYPDKEIVINSDKGE